MEKERDLLKTKAIKFTIEWIVDLDYAVEEGTINALEELQGYGSAEIIKKEIINKEDA